MNEQDKQMYEALTGSSVDDWEFDDLMTVAQVAEHHGCATNTISRILQDATRRTALFPNARKVGGKYRGEWLIPSADALNWKPRTRSRQTEWYVVGKSLHQGDNWKIIGGPFYDRDEAAQCAKSEADDGIREGRQNLQYVEMTEVWSRTTTINFFGSGEEGFDRALEAYYMREAEAALYDS